MVTTQSPVPYGDFIPVYVPVRLVPAVYALIAAEAQGPAQPDEPAVVPEAPATYPDLPWTADDLIRFAATGSTSIRNMCAVMDALATVPGQWLSLTDLADRTGETTKNLTGSMSALTRHVRTKYGRDNWPFAVKSGTDIGLSTTSAHYCMTTDAAALWQEVRNA